VTACKDLHMLGDLSMHGQYYCIGMSIRTCSRQIQEILDCFILNLLQPLKNAEEDDDNEVASSPEAE
jgi:hypothetical protein